MARTFLIALFPLLVVLMFQVGCEEGAAAPPAADDPVGQDVPAQTPPIAPQSVTDTEPTVIGESPATTAADPIPPEDPVAPSAFIVIQNAGPRDAQLLVRQLQQVLPKTQVVKQAQSPNNREIKLEVTNTRDVRALANKIPFASVETVDVAKRTITVDFEL